MLVVVIVNLKIIDDNGEVLNDYYCSNCENQKNWFKIVNLQRIIQGSIPKRYKIYQFHVWFLYPFLIF